MGYCNMHTIRRVIQRVLKLGISLREEKVALGLLGGRAKVKISASDAFRLQNHVFFSEESNIKKGSSEAPQENEGEVKQGHRSRHYSDKLPGTLTFKELVLATDIFIDKTLFIKEVLELDAKAALITRPRRWGKTINMDMLKTFLEIEVDKDGKRLERPENRQLFEGAEECQVTEKKRKKLQRLKICDENYKDSEISIVEKYQGKSPVIFITFETTDDSAETEELLLKNIKSAIRDAYLEHSYLAKVLKNKITNSDCIYDKEPLEKNYYKYLRLAGLSSEPSVDEIESSIAFLSQLLKDHFGCEVYLLIDEYDAPLYGVKNKKCHKYILNRMRSMLIKGVKKNKLVEKTIFTGILRLAKEEYLSVLNNLTEFSIIDQEFHDCFGFNQSEVNYLTEDTLRSSPHVDKNVALEEMKKWYNGYNMRGRILYNPWSIIRCLVSMKKEVDSNADPINAIDNYWIDSGSNELAERVYTNSKNKCDIDKFFDKNSVKLKISRSIDYKDGVFLDTTLNSLLFHTGYITIDEEHKGKISFNKNNIAQLVPILCKIPNLEVKNYLMLRLLSKWAIKKLKFDIKPLELSKLNDADIEDIQSYEMMINNDLLPLGNKNKTEADFCSLLAAVHKLSYFKDKKHDPIQEVQTKNRKKVDTVYAPIKGKSKTGVIHELKKQNQKKLSPSVASLVEDAFWQIYANRYMSVLFKIPYVERIIVRAIVFYRKKGKKTWEVELKEHIFSIEKAKEIDKVFSSDGKVLTNSKKLIKNKKARKEFLKKKIVDSLDALIAKNS